jgi:non-ribosomal peptide synthetase component E (peptide arylation enzyme)
MVRPTRYTQEMFDEYFAKGMWTNDTTVNLWKKHAQQIPDKLAFVDKDRRFTWRQVNALSNVLALNLLNLGLERDSFVFLLLPNWAESYIARCACEKAGILCGTALMTLREREIEYILNTFDAKGIIMPTKFRSFDYYAAIDEMKPRLPELKHILVNEEAPPEGASSLRKMMHEPPALQGAEQIFEQRAYRPTEVSVIGFTSGTTGIPKGSEHIIAARMAMARGYGEPAKVVENDVVLNIISPVAGLSSAFCYNGTANLVGATVVLSDIWSPEETLHLIAREKVTILLAVPAQLAQIVNSSCMDCYELSSLRCIYTSTAPLTYELATRVEEDFGVPCINLYGQIDGGFISAPSIDDPPEVRRCTLGRPHRFTNIQILNDDGDPVAPGERGELVYTGPSTSGGYYRNLEETLNVWGVLGPKGLCRSGDIVQFDEAGHLVLVGRKRDMIIRGGQNIYPAEIEGLLVTHPKIEAVAVVPMPDPIMGEKACAYVKPVADQEFSFVEMTEFLNSKKIAPYKLPERLEIREELPLKGCQKVNKTSLKEEIIRLLKQEGKI